MGGVWIIITHASVCGGVGGGCVGRVRGEDLSLLQCYSVHGYLEGRVNII